MADQGTESSPSRGYGERGNDVPLAGILYSVSIVGFQGDGAGYVGDVTILESDCQRRKTHFSAAALALYLVDFPLYECAGRNYDAAARCDG